MFSSILEWMKFLARRPYKDRREEEWKEVHRMVHSNSLLGARILLQGC